MSALVRFYRTTAGKKTLMAITGVAMALFLLGHLLGNLQVYAGPATLNAYATFLHSHPGLVWTARVVLLGCVLWHVLLGLQLTLRNWSSRPVRYHGARYREADVASRTMIYGGIVLAFFIVYHLLHLTTGHIGPAHLAGDVHANVVAGFRIWWISAFYIAAQLALWLHLYHGLWSLFQTLGLSHPRYDHLRRVVSMGFGLLVVVGNISIPVAILAGVVR